MEQSSALSDLVESVHILGGETPATEPFAAHPRLRPRRVDHFFGPAREVLALARELLRQGRIVAVLNRRQNAQDPARDPAVSYSTPAPAPSQFLPMLSGFFFQPRLATASSPVAHSPGSESLPPPGT